MSTHSPAGVCFHNTDVITGGSLSPQPVSIHFNNRHFYDSDLSSYGASSAGHTPTDRYKLTESFHNARLSLIPRGNKLLQLSMLFDCNLHSAPTALTEDLGLFLSTHVGQLTTTCSSGFKESNTPLSGSLRYPHSHTNTPTYILIIKIKRNLQKTKSSQVGPGTVSCRCLAYILTAQSVI